MDLSHCLGIRSTILIAEGLILLVNEEHVISLKYYKPQKEESEDEFLAIIARQCFRVIFACLWRQSTKSEGPIGGFRKTSVPLSAFDLSRCPCHRSPAAGRMRHADHYY